ncbi:MAG: hypothetical protein ACREYB_10260 [Casimicrobiaceae bacterium]
MRRLMLPLLAGSMIASAAFIVGTVDRLPAEVASHFGGVGANGWMAHDEYLWWMPGLALAVPGAVVLLIAVLTQIAPGLLNPPHRASGRPTSAAMPRWRRCAHSPAGRVAC